VLLFSLISAFYSELPFIYFPNFINGVGFLGRFVISYAAYACELQCHLAFVFGAFLDFVVGYFNNDFRNDVKGRRD